MNRVTYYDDMGYHLKVEFEDLDTVTPLGQYEDSGLTPDEVYSLAKEWTRYETAISYIEELCSIEEFCKAVKEGRVTIS